MKKFIAVLCFLAIAGTAIAGTTLKCEVTDVITPILPEGTGSVLLDCKELEDIKIGDNVKIKISKPKTTAIEGC